mmetsp:Transcript_77048/g.121662  ORF Transcript_77048/g.121662 Transcript_77048/m.121662 type:complete len:84 (-) Transcript_77048:7-258(-)
MARFIHACQITAAQATTDGPRPRLLHPTTKSTSEAAHAADDDQELQRLRSASTDVVQHWFGCDKPIAVSVGNGMCKSLENKKA